MSDSSDIEMKSALPKKTTKKPPKSPTADMLKKQDPKKVTTKEMIHQALIDLKSRKGTSLYAIKKYIEEKYQVDVEKISHIIKKYLKTSVEIGTIVQTKGVGASGSFKLAAGKDKLEKKKKPMEKKVSDKTEKEATEKPVKPKKTKKKMETEKKEPKKPKKVEIAKSAKNNEETEKKVSSKTNEKKEKTKKTSKSSKVLKTPAKKRAAMIKRKSIGSIIKPPKMKPKANAQKA